MKRTKKENPSPKKSRSWLEERPARGTSARAWVREGSPLAAIYPVRKR